MAKYSIEDTSLKAIADAIRSAKCVSTSYTLADMAETIAKMYNNANATASDVRSGKSFYASDGQLKTGTAISAGTLTFSGTNAGKATHYTEEGCSLAVDPWKGMAFVTIQGGTNTGYENIYFQTPTVPEGVTFLATQTYGGPTGGKTQMYFTAVFTGVTDTVDVDVEIGAQNTSYDYVPATITMTYR